MLMLNNDTVLNYFSNLGLGTKTGIDTYFESTKKLVESKKLNKVGRSTMGYGQGISMTQIQIMMALNAVINDGKLLKPYLVDKVEDSKGNIVKQNKPVVIRKVFSDEVSKLSRRYMEASVTRGTGKDAYIAGYRIGGKTGTAQKAEKGGYKNLHVSSFFAFFPVDKPKYGI